MFRVRVAGLYWSAGDFLLDGGEAGDMKDNKRPHFAFDPLLAWLLVSLNYLVTPNISLGQRESSAPCAIATPEGVAQALRCADKAEAMRQLDELGCISSQSPGVSRFPVQQVGGSIHTEYWIPAEELEESNRNIVGLIEVIEEFRV